jgi:hypothetical protein
MNGDAHCALQLSPVSVGVYRQKLAHRAHPPGLAGRRGFTKRCARTHRLYVSRADTNILMLSLTLAWSSQAGWRMQLPWLFVPTVHL